MTPCLSQSPLGRAQSGPARGGWRVTAALTSPPLSQLWWPKAAPGAGSDVGGWRVTAPPAPPPSRPRFPASRPRAARLSRPRPARDSPRRAVAPGTPSAGPARPRGNPEGSPSVGLAPASAFARACTRPRRTPAASPTLTARRGTSLGIQCSASARSCPSPSPQRRADSRAGNFSPPPWGTGGAAKSPATGAAGSGSGALGRFWRAGVGHLCRAPKRSSPCARAPQGGWPFRPRYWLARHPRYRRR